MNENEVGSGWKKSGVPRDQIFVSLSHVSMVFLVQLLTLGLDNKQIVEYPPSPRPCGGRS